MRFWSASAKQMIEVLALMGYSTFELYMEDTYQIEGQPYFGYFREHIQLKSYRKSKACLSSLTWPLCHASKPFGSLISLCQMGCQRSATGDVEDILLSLAKKKFMTWLMVCLRRCLNWKLARSILGWTKPTWLVWDATWSWTVWWIVASSCANTWARAGYCWQIWFPLPDVERYVLQTHVSGWPVRPWCGNSRRNACLPWPSQRPCDLVYWDYYQDSEENTTVTSAITTRLARILPLQGGLKWLVLHPTTISAVSSLSKPIKPAVPIRSRKSSWRVGGQWWWNSSVLYPAKLANLGRTQLPQWFRPFISSFQDQYRSIGWGFYAAWSCQPLPDLPGNLSGINPNRYVFYQDVLVQFLTSTWHLNRTSLTLPRQLRHSFWH